MKIKMHVLKTGYSNLMSFYCTSIKVYRYLEKRSLLPLRVLSEMREPWMQPLHEAIGSLTFVLFLIRHMLYKDNV